MTRITMVLVCALAVGALLSVRALDWPLRPGFVGVALMLAAALAARRYWVKLNWSAPGSPERSLWIGLASTALIAGHMLAALWQIGPRMELHSVLTHAIALDSWTLVAGWGAAWWIARDPDPRRDERDRMIAARALSAAYYTLCLLLLALLIALGFGVGAATRAMTQPMIAHLIIAALMLSCLVDNMFALHAYARDHDNETDAQIA